MSMINNLAYLTALLMVVSITWAELNPDCKNYKVTTHDSFACVCTEAEPCAKVEAPIRTAPGVVTRWQTDKFGARLRKQSLKFYLNGNEQGSLTKIYRI